MSEKYSGKHYVLIIVCVKYVMMELFYWLRTVTYQDRETWVNQVEL